MNWKSGKIWDMTWKERTFPKPIESLSDPTGTRRDELIFLFITGRNYHP